MAYALTAGLLILAVVLLAGGGMVAWDWLWDLGDNWAARRREKNKNAP